MSTDLPLNRKRRILCRLCDADYDSPELGSRAWYAAVDHLLDEHPDQIVARPDSVRSMVSVVKPAGRRTAAEAFRPRR